MAAISGLGLIKHLEVGAAVDGKFSEPYTNLGYRSAIIKVHIPTSPGTGSITGIAIQVPCGPGGTGWKTVYSWTGLTISAAGDAAFLLSGSVVASAAGWTAAPLAGPLPFKFRVLINGTGTTYKYNLSMDLLP